MTIPDDLPSPARPRWLIVAAWLVSTALVVAALRFVDWTRAWESIRTARPAWLVLALLLNASILLIWATLWQTILPPGHRVSLARLAEITSLTSMVLNTVPFLLGEASGMLLLSRRARLGNAAALSVLAVDQLLLGIAKIVLLLLVGLFVPLPEWMRKGLVGLAVAVGALLALLMVSAHRGPLLRQTTEGRPAGMVRRLMSDWAHGLSGLRSGRTMVAALLLEFAKKTAEFAAIIAVQHSFGVHVPIGHSLLVFAALNLMTVLPVSPANLGTYEAAVYFSYHYLGISAAQSIAMAVVQHVCYLLPLAGTGYVVLTVQ